MLGAFYTFQMVEKKSSLSDSTPFYLELGLSMLPFSLTSLLASYIL